MKLKVERCQPETGITFLARVFPNILETLTSMQDPLRTWRKLHITFRNPLIPIADAAVDRVEGYLTTDAHTPIISEYCRMVQDFYGNTAASAEIRNARQDHLKEQNYWARHADEGWPQNPQDDELMMKCISARVGMDQHTLVHFRQQLQTAACTPWHLTPLGVDDDNPYDETLDDDCLPGVEWVDNRSKQTTTITHLQNVRIATETAASGRMVSLAQRVDKGDSPSTAGSSNSRRKVEQRPAQPGRVSREKREHPRQRREKPQRQTDLPKGGTRRGSHSNRKSELSTPTASTSGAAADHESGRPLNPTVAAFFPKQRSTES